MSKHRGRCEASIARVYSEHVVGEVITPLEPVELETCVVGRSKSYVIDDQNVHELLLDIVRRETGVCPDDVSLFRVYKRCQIGGKSFTSGESMRGVRRVREKMFRCGSVITMTTGGRRHGGVSVYGWVKRFITCGVVNMAEITWLPVPDYPTGLPVLVRLMLDGPRPVQPPVVLLEDIDPSPVSLIHDNDTNSVYVIRMIGIDIMS